MTKRYFIPLVMLMAVMAAVLGGCSDTSSSAKNDMANRTFPDVYSKEDTWLVYCYMCGSDLETNYGSATDDIGEILDVELPANVKVLIEAGGSTQWQNGEFSANRLNRYLYDQEGLHELEKAADADMGRSETVADFMRYGQENFPADHRVFIFWDHGGGSANGLCHDERTGNSLSLNDITAALAAVYGAQTNNPPFEIIGFDACLMAAYDVANAINGYARYMVASEEVEPGNGWYYTKWLRALGENPAMGGNGLGKLICDSYLEGCEDAGTDDIATLSVLDMSKLPELTAAYEAFGIDALKKAQDNPRGFFSSFGRGAVNAENYGGNTREQGYANMVDLSDLARGTERILPQTSQKLISAVDNAVIYRVNGEYRDRGSGISGFYSYDGDPEAVTRYIEQDAASLPTKCLYYYLLTGDFPEEAEKLIASSGQSAHVPAAQPLGTIAAAPQQKIFSVSDLEDMAVNIDEDGNSFVTLTQSQMDLLSSVHCQLVYMSVEDDILLFLGSDADIDADWDKGIFKDNFRGVWPMLDGHPVYIEITAECEGYNLYSVPIKLNGTPCNLQVIYNFQEEKYHILGARRGLDSAGMADRNLIKLKAGDQITTIHYAMPISGNDEEPQEVEIDTFTIGENPRFADEKVGDGLFAYCFEFVTPTDDSALSNMVTFTISDDEITTSID